ncbi:ABC transporter-related protein [Pyrolobus fumarii 1A]|uniref:ABC transporter-related protein n=1 Tax=Pyrolobus fumarii (strain DSM 11204 / 1A) TaxID=694429 RepID=G0ECY0_PYRF1|nr:ABC transporter ATP-binding protein [Pyrolobus fumarii]AEM39700.1 ABC transporter-related protein [Pyrolobus fumarii 1A]
MTEDLAVNVREVWKRLRTSWVLRGVTLTLSRGEGLLVLGANGSGKTTLLRIIAGLVRPTRGEVSVLGGSPRDPRVKRLMGVVMHHSLLYGELTVRENLEYYAKLYGVRGYRPEEDPVIQELGLRKFLDRRVEELSFGWRRRADIARALIHSPRLLLIDEPFTGLDDDAQASLAGILERLRREGVAVIATSPAVNAVKLLGGFRVARIVNGRLVEGMAA